MRRSTRSQPISRLALIAALAALGTTAFSCPARAADATQPAGSAPADKATPAMRSAPVSTSADKPAPTAKAPDRKTRDAARKAYTEGEKAYAAGDFNAANTGYARANELIPSSHAAYWAAKSLDQAGKTDDAVRAYEALLADPGSSKIGDEKLSDAQTRLAQLKAAQIGEVTVTSLPASAAVSVDGVVQTGAPPLVLKLAPGPHKLKATAEGFEPQEVDLKITAGSKLEQKLELKPHALPPPPPPAVPAIAPPAPPPPPAEAHSRVPGYVTIGIAGAGAIVGTIFGVKALQSKSDFNDNPTTKSADDTERNALIADMAFGVAVTLGVTGIVLLTSSDETTEAPKAATLRLPPKRTLRVLPYLGRESGGAAARLTF